MLSHLALACVLAAAVLSPVGAVEQPMSDADAVARATQLFQLIRDDQTEEFVKTFNATMTAKVTAEQVREFWKSVREQAGEFGMVTDDRVQRNGEHTAVTLGCKFEGAAVNAVFVFDADRKVAGFSFRPRQ
jgi:hypothetical protein